MTPGKFVTKWRASELKERSASQEHFIDLCCLLDEPTPARHGVPPRGDIGACAMEAFGACPEASGRPRRGAKRAAGHTESPAAKRVAQIHRRVHRTAIRHRHLRRPRGPHRFIKNPTYTQSDWVYVRFVR